MRRARFNRILRVTCAILIVGLMSFPTSYVMAAASPGKQRKTPRRSPSKKIPVTRPMIVEAQQRLADLGYWIPEPDGKFGEASRHALIAFQKVEDRPRTGKLTAAELHALKVANRPTPREKGAAHTEVDLDRQVLFIVAADGTVSKILPVSTGNGELFTLEGYTQPAVTPPGRFRVYRKLAGWRKSDLGLLYYPNYIVGGIAIHGNPAVPAVPASHGCIRIPMFAAQEFSEMTPVGTEVIVYGTRASASAVKSVPRTR